MNAGGYWGKLLYMDLTGESALKMMPEGSYKLGKWDPVSGRPGPEKCRELSLESIA